MDAPSDGKLVDAALAGDAGSFDELVRRYQRPLLRVALSRLGVVDLAEEAVQETFLSAYRSLNQYDSRYSFRTWLWTILLNQCRRTYRRGQRVPQVRSWTDCERDREGSEEGPSGRESSPEDRAAANERAARLERLLEELPQRQADALRLRFFGGLKFHEIAAAMGCSLSSAKSWVRRGLEHMSQRLSGSSGSSSRESYHEL